MTADQAIVAAAKHAKEGRCSLREAEKFLRELLANGPVEATEGEEAAEANGISERTLKRARANLGVKASKAGFKDGWIWTL